MIFEELSIGATINRFGEFFIFFWFFGFEAKTPKKNLLNVLYWNQSKDLQKSLSKTYYLFCYFRFGLSFKPKTTKKKAFC